MNGVRTAISVFIFIVIAVLVRGWAWTTTHQPASQAAASHVVLALGLAATLVGLAALWWKRPTNR